jgi:hypothetical protein
MYSEPVQVQTIVFNAEMGHYIAQLFVRVSY